MPTKVESEIFPIISIKHIVEKYTKEDAKDTELHNDPKVGDVLKQLTDAFTEWGFVYLTDHGINTDEAFKVSKQFFEKEDSFKQQFVRQSNASHFGYVPFKLETFEKSRPFDLKEAFNLRTTPHHLTDDKISQISKFVRTGTTLANDCRNLARLLLRVLSPAVDPKREDFLLDQHRFMGEETNQTTLRLLWYPTIENSGTILTDQLRCGEHSDYGTITFLFQDSVGGLQVVSPSGEYIDATPVPGSIVINIGDLLQIWTSGRFKSTRHRVQVNEHRVPRQSLAYFVYPDNDVNVSCVDGSGKYPTENAFNYLMKKFSNIY